MSDSRIGKNYEENRAAPATAAAIEETTPLDLLRAAHRALLGRYRIAIPLALALAALGGLAAYTMMSPRFVSTGILHVAPTNPGLSLDEEGAVAPPSYKSFVAAQATLIASRAVIDRAIENKRLIATSWPTGEKGLERLAESLRVMHKNGEQLITVAVHSDSPERAQAATDAVLVAYQELYGERNGLSMGVQESVFQARVDRLDASLLENQAAINAITNTFGSYDALQALHDSKVASIAALDEKMTEIAVQRADTELKSSPDERGYELLAMIASGAQAGVQSPAQASIQDLIQEDAKLQSQIERLRARGYGGRHPDIRVLKDASEQIAAAAEHRKRLVTEIIESIGLPYVGKDGKIQQTPQSLSRLQDELMDLRQRLSTEIVTMGKAIGDVNRLTANSERLQTRLDRAMDQLQTIKIQTEDHSLGQVSIAQQASLPVWASSDRRIAGSAVAGIAMFFFGIGLVIVSGSFRTTIAGIRDLQNMKLTSPLLSVFVDPGKRRAERDSLTAVATHDLRNSLFTDAGSHGTRVFAITSAGEPGNQAVLATSLAQSFAMAGYQTLLVDGDLANHVLTNKHNRAASDRGLRDLIETGEPAGAVHRTSKPRLWLMPTGTGREVSADTLSADDVSLVLDMALKHYDVIVIDAGSTTMNLESVLFTGASQRTILAVDRNESKKTVKEATERLERAGDPATGIAFMSAGYEDARRAGMICDMNVANSMYPDGLSRDGRSAPGFDPVANAAGSILGDEPMGVAA